MSESASQLASGNRIYVDTMIFYDHLRATEPATISFFERIKQGDLWAFTSVLTFDELAYRVLLAHIRDKYAGSPLDHLRRNEAKLIAEFYPSISPVLQRWHTFPNLVIVDVTASDILEMHRNILGYQLRPRDAVHLATMRRAGCIQIVSHDSGFDEVPEINRFSIR
jgi:predicted nucleic acid-binding protein